MLLQLLPALLSSYLAQQLARRGISPVLNQNVCWEHIIVIGNSQSSTQAGEERWVESRLEPVGASMQDWPPSMHLLYKHVSMVHPHAALEGSSPQSKPACLLGG